MIIGKSQYKKYLSNFLESNSNYEFALENFNLKIEEDESHIVNNTAMASVVFLDIYDFSNKIKSLNLDSPDKIVSYLRKYYNEVFYCIDEYGGRIDRVMGDGIIAVFSDIFVNRNSKYNDIFKDAYFCCREIIGLLQNTYYEAKAAISLGELNFCEILSSNYCEITCIGEPLTVVYRLEKEADKNEILFLEDIPDNFTNPASMWMDNSNNTPVYLKGIGRYCIKRLKIIDK